MYQIITGEKELLATVKSRSLADACIEQIVKDARENRVSVPRLVVTNTETLEHCKTIQGDPLIEDLDLSVRSYNCLKRARIEYVSTIMNMTVAEISQIRNLGPRCTGEILGKIAENLCKSI